MTEVTREELRAVQGVILEVAREVAVIRMESGWSQERAFKWWEELIPALTVEPSTTSESTGPLPRNNEPTGGGNDLPVDTIARLYEMAVETVHLWDSEFSAEPDKEDEEMLDKVKEWLEGRK